MTDLDELDIPQDAPPEASDGRRCPECGKEFTGPGGALALGRHRKAAHREEWEKGRAEKSRPARSSTGRRSASSPTRDRQPRAPSVKREVEANAAMFYSVVAQLWTIRGDPVGPVLAANVPAIASAWGDLATSNEAVRKFWTGGGGAASWLGLGMAHLPVALAIYETRVAPRLQARREAAQAAMMEDDAEPVPVTVVNGRAVHDAQPGAEPWPAGPAGPVG